MKRTALIALAIAASLTFAGCAQLNNLKVDAENIISAVSSTTVTPNDAYIAINVYDGVEATATNYNRWPRCTGSNGPACRDATVRAQIKKVVIAGRTARNDLKAYLRANPGANITIQSFDDLKAATSELQNIINVYKIT